MFIESYYSLLIGGGVFVGMLVLLEVGRRYGIHRAADDASGAKTGLGAIDAAVFSLLGLLIAFSFSGAAVRFDARRQLAIQESICIGNAWVRLDLLTSEAQAELRHEIRQYLDARLRVAKKMPDVRAAKEELEICSQLQSKIWTQAVGACTKSPSPQIMMLLLPALDQMFDIATTRTETAQIHPPKIIFGILIVLALGSATLAGHGMAGAKKRSWLHIIGLSAAISAAVFVIVDLEYPRAGLIRLDATDQFLVDLRQSMNSPP